jgi:protein-tyrosine phosphatase
VRDLGGLPASGGTTRSGVLLRSDALDGLTEADVEHLVDVIGLAQVVDLRTAQERAERGRGRLDDRGVSYAEVEVFNHEALERRRARRGQRVLEGADPIEVMAEGYRELLAVGGRRFVTAIERITDPGGTPALVHCSAGKDRTGILVALLLDLAGVERAAVIADYAATALRMVAVMERLLAAESFQRVAHEVPAFVYEARAETMERFLAELEAEYGGVASFLTAHGLTSARVERWRSLFIEPN